MKMLLMTNSISKSLLFTTCCSSGLWGFYSM